MSRHLLVILFLLYHVTVLDILPLALCEDMGVSVGSIGIAKVPGSSEIAEWGKEVTYALVPGVPDLVGADIECTD
jgi:hypothetical protein